MINLNLTLLAMNGHNIQLNCLNLTIIVPKVTAYAKEQFNCIMLYDSGHDAILKDRLAHSQLQPVYVIDA